MSILPEEWIILLEFVCVSIGFTKRATQCTEAPAFAGSGTGSHHLVYCTQPYPVFTQEAVSRTRTRDLTVTLQNPFN